MTSFAFGFRLDSAHALAQLDENGMGAKVQWMDVLAQTHGLVKPEEGDEEEQDYENEAKQALWAQYYAAQRELVESLGCCIHEYGHEYTPEFFVEVCVPQDGAYALCKPLDLDAMKAADSSENRERLRHFCAVMSIEYSEPSWCALRSISLD